MSITVMVSPGDTKSFTISHRSVTSNSAPMREAEYHLFSRLHFRSNETVLNSKRGNMSGSISRLYERLMKLTDCGLTVDGCF